MNAVGGGVTSHSRNRGPPGEQGGDLFEQLRSGRHVQIQTNVVNSQQLADRVHWFRCRPSTAPELDHREGASSSSSLSLAS